MKSEEIQRDIKNIKQGIATLEDNLVTRRSRLARAQTQLAEAEKPETENLGLRHGDYGIGPAGAWIRVHGSTWWDTKRPSGPSHHDADIFIPYRLGNIFDDMEKWQE